MSKSSTTTLLQPKEQEELIETLKLRFQKNNNRHKEVKWSIVVSKLEAQRGKLWSLHEMERTGGEPDVVSIGNNSEIIFFDCSAESPAGRRSLCYDQAALDSRKEHKPKDSAVDMAAKMGIRLLNEEQYRLLQQFGSFDMKTSSWVETPASIRLLGGAIFCDRRYNQVFTYHNGAESYYAARGFRGYIKI